MIPREALAEICNVYGKYTFVSLGAIKQAIEVNEPLIKFRLNQYKIFIGSKRDFLELKSHMTTNSIIHSL